jgi:hypothetical protein
LPWRIFSFRIFRLVKHSQDRAGARDQENVKLTGEASKDRSISGRTREEEQSKKVRARRTGKAVRAAITLPFGFNWRHRGRILLNRECEFYRHEFGKAEPGLKFFSVARCTG